MSNESNVKAMAKTHYRKVFKSDHLGVADLEDLIEAGSDLTFTISHVRQEYGVRVAGKKGDHNIAYFVEKIKPLVLNAGNSKILKALAGGSSFVEDWRGIRVRLYINHDVSFGGEITGGVRIHPDKPAERFPELTKAHEKMWANAVAAYIRDGNFDAILKRATLSEESKQAIIAEAEAMKNEVP